MLGRSQRRRNSQAKAERLEQKLYLAAIIASVDPFVAQPLQNEQLEFSFYNDLGGDRGEVKSATGGEVFWNPGSIRAEISGDLAFAGIFESVNGVIREGNPLDFNALFPAEILPAFQPQADALLLNFAEGLGPVTVKLESPSGQSLFAETVSLASGSRNVRVQLPNPAPANVQAIVITVDGAAGNFFVLDDIAIEIDTPDMGSLEQSVWSYAALRANYDEFLNILGDRKNFPAADFANVPATGGLALAAVQMESLGVISQQDALAIVTGITNTFLSLPTLNGLLPHFVEDPNPSDGLVDLQIIPGTEFSSVDTTAGLLPLLEARQLLGLSTTMVEQLFIDINWENLILPNGTISHGYTDTGELLPTGWDVWSSESFLVGWAYAAARPNAPLADLVFPTPPTFDGAQFNDELAALFLNMTGIDVWGNDWQAYRTKAANEHVNAGAAMGGLLSPAEVAEPWTVPAADIYQAFGIGGIIGRNDGSALTGQVHGAPHALGLVASHEPAAAQAGWEFLKQQGVLSPINTVESLYVGQTEGVPHAVANPLKSGWNLMLQTLGWSRAATGANNYLAYDAAAQNDFIAAGFQRLMPGNDPYDDLVGRAANGTVAVLESSGTQFANGVVDVVPPSVDWDDFLTGDFNGDGRTDWAGRSPSDGRWRVILSNGGTFGPVADWGAWSTNVTFSDLLVGDFNNDGRDDVAGRASTGTLVVGLSTGSAFATSAFGAWSTNVEWVNILVGDVNADGRDDLIGRASTNTWVVAISDGHSFATSAFGSWSTNVSWLDVLAGDADGDGRTDIIGRASTGTWVVGVSDGSRFTMQSWGAWTSSLVWSDVRIGDFDGDGRADIVGRASNGRVVVAESNGSRFLMEGRTIWSTNVDWLQVVVGDFTGDGLDDLAGRASTGTWIVAVSGGGQFVNQVWGAWTAATTWDNVSSGSFT